MRRLVMALTAAFLVGTSPAAASQAPSLLARGKHPVVAFDFNGRWVAWAEEEERRSCTRIYRRNRSTGRVAPMTRCRRVEFGELHLTGSRVFWSEGRTRSVRGSEHGLRTERAVLTTNAPGRLRVLARMAYGPDCDLGSSLNGVDAGESVFAFGVRSFNPCNSGEEGSGSAVRWVDSSSRRIVVRTVPDSGALSVSSVAGRRIAGVEPSASAEAQIVVREADTGRRVFSTSAPRGLWEIALGGRYLVFTYDISRAVYLARYDTETGERLGGTGTTVEDAEGGDELAMAGRNVALAWDWTVVRLDAATGARRRVHVRRRSNFSFSDLAVHRRTVAWVSGRHIYGHALPPLPRLQDRR